MFLSILKTYYLIDSLRVPIIVKILEEIEDQLVKPFTLALGIPLSFKSQMHQKFAFLEIIGDLKMKI